MVERLGERGSARQGSTHGAGVIDARRSAAGVEGQQYQRLLARFPHPGDEDVVDETRDLFDHFGGRHRLAALVHLQRTDRRHTLIAVLNAASREDEPVWRERRLRRPPQQEHLDPFVAVADHDHARRSARGYDLTFSALHVHSPIHSDG